MPVSKQTASGREIATVKTDVAALGHMLAKVEAAISKISETHTVSYTHLTLPTIIRE